MGQLAAAELHPGQGVSMGQQAEAVQVLEGDGLPGRQGVAQRHGDAEAVVQIRPYLRCKKIYSMMDRAYEKGVIPYCQEHNIGFVAFSPIASGYLSGKVDPNQTFTGDDVRQWVPQLKKENMLANRPLLEVLSDMAARKHATNAQITLAWMLRKYPHVVPTPGSKNKGRILENLGAWEVELTDGEFQELEDALGRIAIHGQRSDLGNRTEFIDA